MAKDLVIKFKSVNMILQLKKLVVKVDHGKRVIFNIKKSISNITILGKY